MVPSWADPLLADLTKLKKTSQWRHWINYFKVSLSNCKRISLNESKRSSVLSHCIAFCGWTAPKSHWTRCRGHGRGQQSEEWEFLIWEKLSLVKADSSLCSLQIFSLLSAFLNNPCPPDMCTPPQPFQSVNPTCALLNPSHHQGAVGVIICSTVICP